MANPCKLLNHPWSSLIIALVFGTSAAIYALNMNAI